MRDIELIFKDMARYLEKRRLEGVDNDFNKRNDNYLLLKNLYDRKDYKVLIKQIEIGVVAFSKISLFKQTYLSYLKELKANLTFVNQKEKVDRLHEFLEAIHNEDLDKVDILLKKGALAVINESYPVKTKLIDKDETPLQAALKTKNPELIIKMLQEARGFLTINEIIEQISIGKILDPSKKPIDTPLNDEGYTLLHFAAEYGLVDFLEELLEKGANINVLTTKNETPLYLACRRNQEEVAVLLLENGADPNRLATLGEASVGPLTAAVYVKNKKLIYELLEFGAKVNEISYKMAQENKKQEPEIYDLLRHNFRKKKHSIIQPSLSGEKFAAEHFEELPSAIRVLAKRMYFENTEIIQSYLFNLAELYEESDDLRPIIDMLALGSTGKRRFGDIPFKVVITDEKTMHLLIAGGEKGVGCYTGKNTLYLSSAHSQYSLAIFLHESKHYVDKEIFTHSLLGFPALHSASFNKIMDEISNNLSTIIENNPHGIEKILAHSLRSVFVDYALKERRGELIARIPEVLGALGQEKGQEWLNANVPDLYVFYKKSFLPVCNRFLKEANFAETMRANDFKESDLSKNQQRSL